MTEPDREHLELFVEPEPDPEPVPWRRKDTAYLVSVVLLVAVSLAIGFMRWKT